MYSTIKTSTNDIYCRYLNISFNNYSPNLLGGQFNTFLAKELKINSLPYNIKIIDLIVNKCLSVDLFIKLPTEGSYLYDLIKHYKKGVLTSKSKLELTSNDIHHPYDVVAYQSNDTFQTQITSLNTADFLIFPNGRWAYAHEGYLAYWRGFVLLEALDECTNIQYFLNKKEGSKKFFESVQNIDKYWNSYYHRTFSRLSHYKTVVAKINSFSEPNLTQLLADKNVGEYVLNFVKTSKQQLENDVKKLLVLYKKWSRKLGEQGKGQYKYACEILKKDIYLLINWLCELGEDITYYLNQWGDRNRLWMSLKDVLDFEDFFLEDTFKLYTSSKNNPSSYLYEAATLIRFDNPSAIYKRLVQLPAFAPWLRAFGDIHKSINKQELTSFNQPRVLDSLMVLAIRTEMVIRSIYHHRTGQTDPRDLKDLWTKISERFKKNTHERGLFGTISQYTVETDLEDKPSNLFNKIEGLQVNNKWSKSVKHFCQSILCFIIARNYFAHHSYKDIEINDPTSPVSRRILVACLETVLYIDHVTSLQKDTI